MSILEIIVIIYHSLAVLLILAFVIDYTLGLDKLKFIPEAFNDWGEQNPIAVFFALEFMCMILLMFTPIIGFGTALFFITAITLMYFIVFVLFIVLLGIGYCIEAIRNKCLKNR